MLVLTLEERLWLTKDLNRGHFKQYLIFSKMRHSFTLTLWMHRVVRLSFCAFGLLFGFSLYLVSTFLILFADINDVHQVVEHSYSCALERSFLYHGRMYITAWNICFHSNVFSKQLKVTFWFSVACDYFGFWSLLLIDEASLGNSSTSFALFSYACISILSGYCTFWRHRWGIKHLSIATLSIWLSMKISK